MSPTISTKIAIPDANILIALCAKEPKQSKAEKALEDYANDGWEFYEPNIIVAEVLYVLCQKHQGGTFTDKTYQEAVENFQDQMKAIVTISDADLIKRAFEIQQSYGCSRSADSIYIALAEHLAKSQTVEIVTFDGGRQKRSDSQSKCFARLIPIRNFDIISSIFNYNFYERKTI